MEAKKSGRAVSIYDSRRYLDPVPEPVLQKSIARRWPKAIISGAIAEQLAKFELLHNEIMPCKPAVDIGYDIVTCHNAIMKRVQIKSQSSASTHTASLSFSTVRHKNSHGKVVKGRKIRPAHYAEDELDIFLFVHTVLRRFYAVPASEIGIGQTSITLPYDSEWANAWELFKQP